MIHNANIITMDPANPSAEWVAVSGGIVQALGTGRDYERFTSRSTEFIDCRGSTVLPGFIDAHLHLHAFAESHVCLNLSHAPGFKSIKDIQAAIRNQCQVKQPETWIIGRGYNEFHLAEKRHPTRWDLDEAAPDHPVKLTHGSGHAHVLNSLALSLAGISTATEDPPQGLIDRDVRTGEPTGLLYEMGEFLSGRIPALEEQELLRGLKLANRELLSLGITSVQDASHLNDFKRWKEVSSWKERGLLVPRVNFMVGPKGFEELRMQDFSCPIPENQLRLGGVKVIVDQTTGDLHPRQDELNKMVLAVHQSGLQVAVHAIEENAVESACSAIAYALENAPRPDHRHRIEHCSVCRSFVSKRLASLGVTVVTQPSFIFYNGDRYLETVPDEQLQHLYPIGSLLKAGVPVAGGSDCPIVPPNPLFGIYSAISRRSQTGRTVVGAESIDPLDALRMYTSHAARATFEETVKGSIAPGKPADLVVLNGDPAKVPVDEIKDLQVEMTILNGEVVWAFSPYREF